MTEQLYIFCSKFRCVFRTVIHASLSLNAHIRDGRSQKIDSGSG